MSVELRTGGRESLALPVAASVDPTGSPPEFGFVAFDPDGPDLEPEAYTPGTWESATRAITPTIGGPAGTAGVKLAPGEYVPWFRATVGVELIVRKLRRITMVESAPATP